MKKKTPILDLYYRWMISNQLTKPNRTHALGLCQTALASRNSFRIICPVVYESAFWGRESMAYWGGKFSPLRKNLVLLLAAIEGEL